jgi:hypothetical protein
MADPRAILDPLSIPSSVKADAWDAYHASKDQVDFQKRFNTLAIPKEAKAALWDSKFQDQPSITATPLQAGSAILGTFLDTQKGEMEKVWKGVGNTASALKDMAVQAVTPPTTPEEKIASSFGPLGRPIISMGKGLLQAGDVFHQQLRSGDIGGATKTAVEQLPGGRPLMRGDVSEAIGEAGSALALPKLTREIPGAARIAAKIPAKVGEGVKVAATETLGKTTGVGSAVLKRAIEKPSPELTTAMRGGTTELEVVKNFREALQNVKDARGETYRKQLSELPEQDKHLDITPIRRSVEEGLRRFNVKKDADGNLDFSRSTISDAAGKNEVLGIYNDVMSWGDKHGDLTPAGVDILKRRVDDHYSTSSSTRALVQRVKDSSRTLLNREVPGYFEMTRDYAKASEFLEQVKDLSLESPNPGTAVRKLTTLLNQNNGYRQVLAQKLSEYTPVDLEGQLAGLNLSKWGPRGLAGPANVVSGAGLIYGVITHAINPLAAVGFAAASPRLMGELLTFLAKKPPKNIASPAVASAPRIAGLLGPGPIRMGPIPDTSGVRAVDATADVIPGTKFSRTGQRLLPKPDVLTPPPMDTSGFIPGTPVPGRGMPLDYMQAQRALPPAPPGATPFIPQAPIPPGTPWQVITYVDASGNVRRMAVPIPPPPQ